MKIISHYLKHKSFLPKVDSWSIWMYDDGEEVKEMAHMPLVWYQEPKSQIESGCEGSRSNIL